jgi:hypothetical protein
MGNLVINLGETSKKTKFTPPSLIKATTKDVTSNGNNLGLTSVSNDDDVNMTSSTQNEELQENYSTPVKESPLEGKTTAVVDVMRGNLKHGYHCHHSNKHYKKKIVWVPVRQWI